MPGEGRLRPAWIFFDAGNTLIGLDYSRLIAALAREGFPVTEQALRRAEMGARRGLDRAIMARWTGGEVPRSGWVESDVWLRFWARALQLCGASPYDAERLAQTVLVVTRPASSWNRVESTTLPLLGRLRERGCRLAIISNSNGTLGAHLESIGLRSHFEFVVDSAEVGVEKPHPAIFQLALDRAGGLDAPRGLYVGDVYSIDVVGAAGAGMPAVLFDPLGQWDASGLPEGAPECRTLSTLVELEDLIGGG